MKKGVSCSVEWSDGCIYAGKILGIGKEVMYMYIVDRSCDYSLCKTIAGTINSLAIEYEQDRASVPNDDCVDPKRKKRRLGQFHKQYTRWVDGWACMCMVCVLVFACDQTHYAHM